jgi:hypothetical protein
MVFDHVLRSCEEAEDKIVSIHSRRAAAPVLDSLDRFGGVRAPILHWFSGTRPELGRAADRGCWFSVGPPRRGQRGKRPARHRQVDTRSSCRPRCTATAFERRTAVAGRLSASCPDVVRHQRQAVVEPHQKHPRWASRHTRRHCPDCRVARRSAKSLASQSRRHTAELLGDTRANEMIEMLNTSDTFKSPSAHRVLHPCVLANCGLQ